MKPSFPAVTAIAPWFGGKRTMAPAIAEMLGEHGQYFELFCGSMAVLFAKRPSQKETANDLHGDLINLARVIQDELAAAALYARLGRTIMAEGILEDARAYLEDPANAADQEPERRPGDATPAMLERAFWYFVASWMGRNGTAGTERQDYQMAVRWTANGGSPTTRFANATESIPWWHRRLKNVVILRRDALTFADRLEDTEATAIYADPPYAQETRGDAGTGIKTGGRYLHEFNHGASALFGERDDHARLAEILRAYRRARVVVSAYDCPRYRELYAGWTFVEMTRQKNLNAQSGRGTRTKDAPEVLITNRSTP